jgi:hypothetical protein
MLHKCVGDREVEFHAFFALAVVKLGVQVANFCAIYWMNENLVLRLAHERRCTKGSFSVFVEMDSTRKHIAAVCGMMTYESF